MSAGALWTAGGCRFSIGCCGCSSGDICCGALLSGLLLYACGLFQSVILSSLKQTEVAGVAQEINLHYA